MQATLDDLRTDMHALDDLLARAVAQAQRAFGARAHDHRFAGLVIGDDEPESLLSRPLAEVAYGGDGGDGWASRGRRLTRVISSCGLTAFDAAVLLLAIGPEIDLRYERIYAYLQDDVTRRRPTVALALDLFARDAADKLALRRRFLSDAPLREHALLELVGNPDPAPPPLLAHGLRPASGVVRYLLGEPALDDVLMVSCRLDTPSDDQQSPALPDELRRRLTLLGEQAAWNARGPVVLLDGGDRIERRSAANALACGARRQLLSVDLRSAADDDLRAVATAARRSAILHEAVVHVIGGDSEQRSVEDAGLLLDGTVPAIAGLDLARAIGRERQDHVRVEIPQPDLARGRLLCSTALSAVVGASEGDAVIADSVARRFRWSPEAIEGVVAMAKGKARWRSTATTPHCEAAPTSAEFMEAAREATRWELDGVARRITPRRTRAELILPPDRLALLDAIRTHVEFAPIVADKWGFARTMSEGVVAMFSGPPGTGKTLAAEVLAGELGLDLYAIDLSQVVSKYIGETEKNLARVFDAAERSSAVLFFDEADALFGARSEVRDAHDRYANIEVGYLLQRLEQFSGLAVLASNLQRNIDEAFLRRARFVVLFPLPDADSRRRIWEATWPPRAPASDLDWTDLAARFDVTGATIRDAAVSAAFLAAADGGSVTMAHVEEAMTREYAKLGRVPVDPSRRAAHNHPPPSNIGVA